MNNEIMPSGALTVDQINAAWEDALLYGDPTTGSKRIWFARAVIAADRVQRQDEQEPIYLCRYSAKEGWREASEAAYYCFSEKNHRIVYAAPQTAAPVAQAVQEPVAWMSRDGALMGPSAVVTKNGALYGWTPLFTAPQPMPTDKDAEIAALRKDAERLDWLVENRAYVVSDIECCDGFIGLIVFIISFSEFQII